MGILKIFFTSSTFPSPYSETNIIAFIPDNENADTYIFI